MNELAQNLVSLLESDRGFIRHSAISTLENIVPRFMEKEFLGALGLTIKERLEKNSFGENQEIKNCLTKAGEFVEFYYKRS